MIPKAGERVHDKLRTMARAPAPPQPWARVPRAALAAVHGVMTDIDDTLTRDGAIEPAALAALHALAGAGVPVVAITGRPLGWSEPFAREWPVAAIVAENGAVALVRDGGSVHTEFVQDEATRAHNRMRLREAAMRIVREVPGAQLARDSRGRVTDIAIDHSEFTTLPPAAIGRVCELMREAGMNATVSSIHVNGWYGSHSKLTAAAWMTERLFGRTFDDAEAARWVYVGDSTNDQAMFGRFPLSVGVANLMRFERELRVWPAYLARGERGEGFAEVAQALLACRAAS
jgi:HAD superfamily hydrolase (TIGR01484 family)